MEETIRRHATRPKATAFTPEHMRSWYTPRDLLGLPGEQVIPGASWLEETVAFIARSAGLPLAGRSTDLCPQAAGADRRS